MPSNKYSTFRNRTEVSADVNIRKATEFIENSASSVEALRESNYTNIKAVIISERKEGGDETILFTYAEDEIVLGEYITYRNKTYLVYSEYNVIFSDAFKKHKLIECNIELKWGENIQKAYYISSLRKYSGLVNLGVEIPYEFSSQKPLVITKANSNFKAGTRFIISGEGFVVNDLDKFSNSGIYYASVEKATVYSDIDDIATNTTEEIPAATATVSSGEIVAGEDITITTNSAYAVFSHDVEIVSKSTTQVIFEAPIGVQELIVDTKDSGGNIITTVYKVVI
jgi:hypothetical protein